MGGGTLLALVEFEFETHGAEVVSKRPRELYGRVGDGTKGGDAICKQTFQLFNGRRAEESRLFDSLKLPPDYPPSRAMCPRAESGRF